MSLAILQEKREKFQAMVEGKREIPRELKTVRNLPGLGPNYRFTPEMRIRAEQLNKEQDRQYVELCLSDLSRKVIPGAERDLEDTLDICKRRIARNVATSDAEAAEILFNEESTKLRGLGQHLLSKRRPQQKGKRRADGGRPSKRPRKDRPSKPVNRKQ